MTDLKTIFENNFDTNICSKPNFYDGQMRSIATMKRGVVTLLSNTSDEIIGIMERYHFDPNSHDGYICWVVSDTLDDARNIVKALKKVAATYSPTSEENIIQWEEGSWSIFLDARFEFKFIVIVRKAGVVAY